MYTVVNQFVCPSDYSDPLPTLGGQTNYMADMGSGIVWQAAVNGNASLPSPNGVFHGDSATSSQRSLMGCPIPGSSVSG